MAITDAELGIRARSGDTWAEEMIYRRHAPQVASVARRLLRDPVEAADVTQETFVRAYQAIARFDGRSEPFTWLYRIAVNLSLNQIRSRKSRAKTSIDDDPRILSLLAETRPSLGGDPAGARDQRKLAEALVQGIEGLSDTLRTTLVLVCIDGLSHEEASQVLGCPEGTIAWRIHEARRKLRAYLEEKGLGGEVE